MIIIIIIEITHLALDGCVGERLDRDAGGAAGASGELELLNDFDREFGWAATRGRRR